MKQQRSRRATRALTGAVVAMFALSACVGAGTGAGGRAILVAKSAAVITFKAAGAKQWNPSRSVVVLAEDGKLTAVDVSDAKGHKVPGEFAKHSTVWRSTGPVLAFDTKYTMRAEAVDESGLKVRRSASLRTVAPKNQVYTGITPYGNPTVGVGMPIIVTYDKPVARKAVAERHLEVTTQPRTVGSWHWVGDQMVRWRPKTYWQPGTNVTVHSQLAGVQLGPDTWGNDDDTVHFSIGDSQISTVDIATHMMTVRRNGEVVRTIPVTTGKPGWDTRIGIKVIMSKDREVVMDAASIDVDKNDPEYYRLDVEYAMRLTWSGEYLHAAPWSVASQGHENVSHGCTGMSQEDAIWLYNSSQIGDVVNYTNGVRSMEPWNGYTDWNVPWDVWQAGSALH